jgi:hypothetical protein
MVALVIISRGLFNTSGHRKPYYVAATPPPPTNRNSADIFRCLCFITRDTTFNRHREFQAQSEAALRRSVRRLSHSVASISRSLWDLAVTDQHFFGRNLITVQLQRI